MRVLLIFMLGIARAAHDYFEYENCGETCTAQRSCCTISEQEGNFITTCCNSEDCMARENNLVVCLRPGLPPVGGSDIWNDFHQAVYPPTPVPPQPSKDNCMVWRSLVGVGWSIVGLFIVIGTMKFVLKKMRSRNNFERVINPDSPYQDTVQDIESVDD